MGSSWFFNFSFSSSFGAGSDVAVDGDSMLEMAAQNHEKERQQQHQQTSNKQGEWQSVSSATSPMSTYAGTPKPPLDTHTSFSECTVAAAATAATRTTRRRRSSVFFKLPDVDKINSKNLERSVNNNRDEESADMMEGVGLSARRLARSSFGRSSRRRASIVPAARIATQARVGNVAPIRALVNDIITTSTDTPGSGDNSNEDHDSAARVSENGSAEEGIGSDDGGKGERGREALRGKASGKPLPGCGVSMVPAVPDKAIEQSAPSGGDNRRPRTSPRALSEGHR